MSLLPRTNGRVSAITIAVTVVVFGLTAHSSAWHEEGHIHVARAAVASLPDDVPAFLRNGVGTIAHVAVDPDVVRDRQLPQVRDAEGPEHYLDLELLDGRPLPATRYEMLALCAQMQLDPRHVGMLPYAITEMAQRLTMALAEHRQHPDNPHIRAKCLVYAGWLAHYTADLHMPLHTTIHYDGRVGPDRRSPRTGIHERVDALPAKLSYDVLFEEALPAPVAHVGPEAMFAYVVAQLEASHAEVDRVYALEQAIPALDEPTVTDEAVVALARDRLRAAGHFTASVLLSAWRHSADVEPAGWIDRATFDEAVDAPGRPAGSTAR